MRKTLVLFAALALFAACNNSSQENTQKATAEVTNANDTNAMKNDSNWHEHATIYEVNVRQYTSEGTLKAFQAHLPRLEELGVKILWFMPIQPIGEEKRKGTLGSYYSIKDYTAVNPNFGTLDDFKAVVEDAHSRGMKVILDWVANHTAWDHHWINEHPEWYTKNEKGEIVAPVEDWSDVADLNYDAEGMPQAMTDEMLWWVNEADIDGFRCDMAMMVPLEFWQNTRKQLEAVKPVFMLAEAEGPEFHNAAFDMTYSWELHHLMNDIAKGEKQVTELEAYRQKQDSLYQPKDYRMAFTTNHDENSWQGTVYERMGNNHKNFFVLCATFQNCMPLIYSGQEAGLNHRLSFFEKDSIDFKNDSLLPFYQKVIDLKTNHPALANGASQGDFQELITLSQMPVYAYKRAKGQEEVVVMLNFSNNSFGLESEHLLGSYTNVLTGETLQFNEGTEVRVPAHNFLLLKK